MNAVELTYLLIATWIWLTGYLHHGRFVRPKWKIPGKYLFYLGVSFVFVHWLGHWGAIFVIGQPLLGWLFHRRICRKHAIDWRTCEPREKYLALQQQWAKGDFKN